MKQVFAHIAPAVLGAGLALAAGPGAAQVLDLDAPPEAFGETSYYGAYPKQDPDDLTPQALWASCWAFVKAEGERLDAAAEAAPEPLKEELEFAAGEYHAARIQYGELIHGTAIADGIQNADVNAALTIEEQALIGAGPQWLARNAADCIFKMPVYDMPDFPELYPWLSDSLGSPRAY